MKQRITYISEKGNAAEAGARISAENGLHVQSLRAAKEDRITLGVKELPKELLSIVEQCRELRIRWASPESHGSISPFTSRLSPGLHVFWTPDQNGENQADLCSVLKRAFSEDLKCNSENAFSTPPILSTRFTSAANLQYYSVLTSLSRLRTFVTDHSCQLTKACTRTVDAFSSASTIDFDYDAISQALVITGYWSSAVESNGWTESISAPPEARVEVGVLRPERNPTNESPHELTFGGHLTVLENPSTETPTKKPTFFSFPSRHHYLGPRQTFETTFDKPTGLHPTLRLIFPTRAPTAPQPACRIHAYLTLPSTLFLDRYAFRDNLTLKSHNLTALHALSGATDLEAPEWLVPTWGSAALFELAPNSTSATIPLHLRYLKPAPGGYTNVSVPVPTVFWACHAEEGTKFATNPFDRTSVGYDALFGVRTAFYHVQPTKGAQDYGREGSLLRDVTVPVLDTAAPMYPYIEPVTMLLVFAGFVWIAWRAMRPLPDDVKSQAAKGEKQR